MFIRQRDPFHLLLLAVTAGLLVFAAMSASVPWCLLVLTFVPLVSVVWYETVGHRHLAEALLES